MKLLINEDNQKIMTRQPSAELSLEHQAKEIFENLLKEERFQVGEYRRVGVMDTGCKTWLSWEIAMAHNDFVAAFLDKAFEKRLDISSIVNQETRESLFNNRAIHVAVAKGYVEKDGFGKKLEVSNLELVKKLIRAGADCNVVNSQSQNKFLLDRRINPLDRRINTYEKAFIENATLYNHTPLSLAVARGDSKMVEAILKSPKLSKITLETAIGIGSMIRYAEYSRREEDGPREQGTLILKKALEFEGSKGFTVMQDVYLEEEYNNNQTIINSLINSSLEVLKYKNEEDVELKEAMRLSEIEARPAEAAIVRDSVAKLSIGEKGIEK